MDSRQWFRDAGYGMMIHWGLYALIGGEWRGKRMPYIGEWAQNYFKIPTETYSGLASAFNPLEFNADDWAKTALDAGMKYMVVTSKHHEGFAMFRSECDKFNIYDCTPFKRDVIAELAEACYKYGIKLGLYYSQDLDWHDPDGGGYTRPHNNVGGMGWSNDWDWPDADKKDYSRCFERKIKPQVKELMTRYGDICLVWFDTPCTISVEQGRELYDIVKRYQPNCLVNSRIGNGLGDYKSWGDNQIPDEYMTDGLYESPATLNDTWGYKAFDTNWKSPERVAEIRRHLNERGINYLLNVGPDHLGRIPSIACDILREARD